MEVGLTTTIIMIHKLFATRGDVGSLRKRSVSYCHGISLVAGVKARTILSSSQEFVPPWQEQLVASTPYFVRVNESEGKGLTRLPRTQHLQKGCG